MINLRDYNIMKAVNTPEEERTWLGDEDMGWCQNCYSNALVLGEKQWDGAYYPIKEFNYFEIAINVFF